MEENIDNIENENENNIDNGNQENVQNNNNEDLNQNEGNAQENQQIQNNNQNQVNNGNNPQQNEILRKRKEENNKTVEIIKSKIKDLTAKFNFCMKYYGIMNKIITVLKDLTYEKLTNSINECFNYFSFFKHSSELYSSFAERIKETNSSIMSSLNIPKMNDNFLLGEMQKTQNLLCKNLSSISTGLKQNIISKGPLSKLEEKVDKINSIKKANSHKFKDVEELLKKVFKHYHKYDKLFESYLPSLVPNNEGNNNNRNRVLQRPPLVDTPDFVLIVNELMERINKLVLSINLFVIDTKDTFYKINQLFVEMNNLVKESVLIYIKESKNVFNIDVAKNFEEIENYYKELDKKNEDKMFKLNLIFNSKESQENIHTLLDQYHTLLSKSGRVKNELIADKTKFSIEKYTNLLLFFEWLISISPQPNEVPVKDLIIKELKIKRDPGVFKSWRDSIMIFTRQSHLLIYDNSTDKEENFVKIFELDKTSYRKKLDNKKPFLFELTANRKGKVMDFKGTYLYDGLNEKTANQIHPLILSTYT